MTTTPQETAGDRAGLVDDVLIDIGVPSELVGPIGSAVVFVIVAVVLYAVGNTLVVPLVDTLLRRRGINQHARKPVRIVGSAAVVFVAFSVAFSVAGFGNILLALATVGAAATLAVGLALQDLIRNFVAGVFIYADKPFRTDDWIEWGEHSGYVEEISLRVTRVRTFNNEHLTVPNAQLTEGVIKNYDRNKKLRLTFTFRISLRDDIDQATDIILEEAQNQEGILADPEPSVKLTELNESSFGLQSRIWIQNPGRSDFLGIRGQFVQAVTERFGREGVTIPYPHRTIDGHLGGPGSEPAGTPTSD